MLIQIDRATKKAKAQAQIEVGKFSNPSKMPCYSWSIPTEYCVTGSKLAKIEGTPCFECYAQKGFYNMPSTVNAMERRYKIFQTIDREKFISDFVVALVGEEYFRWFDSGDVQSLEMLETIAEIARQTPSVKHWLPTREYAMVHEYLKKHGAFPENLLVRLSCTKIDLEKHPMETGNGSLIVTKWENAPEHAVKCSAPAQEGKCKDCRACWNKDVQTVAYLLH
jgi:hypothetical protein